MTIPRLVAACALSSAAFTAQLSGAPSSAAAALDPVIQWNRHLLAIVRTPGAQPPAIHPTRSFAILHAAIYDAVNAIDQTHQPYALKLTGVSRRASQSAAVAAAAHEVLAVLYPAFAATLDQQYQESLALVPDGAGKTDGARIGFAVAEAILALRSQDGANATPPTYVFGTGPGDYQSTPPNFPLQPQLTQWPNVAPFVLRRANQFRPGAPPPLSSDRYSDDLNEIQSVGVAAGTAATADEALTGRFWNGAIQNYWNEIAQTAAIDRRLDTASTARLFALLNLSVADSVIAFYDAKYTYNRWRPVTAIRAADSDDNPDTTADLNWLPLVGTTAPDPAYPGAHAVVSGAGATVLQGVFRDRREFNVTSEVLPGVERSFSSFEAAAAEASLSRIFAGQHFRRDLTIGQRLGRDVADFVLDHYLQRRH
jgi:membrane-associated phospholipid phosphatase